MRLGYDARRAMVLGRTLYAGAVRKTGDFGVLTALELSGHAGIAGSVMAAVPATPILAPTPFPRPSGTNPTPEGAAMGTVDQNRAKSLAAGGPSD